MLQLLSGIEQFTITLEAREAGLIVAFLGIGMVMLLPLWMVAGAAHYLLYMRCRLFPQ